MLVGLAVAIAACAQSGPRIKADFLQAAQSRPRVLLVPPDVTVFKITKVGLPVQSETWTAGVSANIRESVTGILGDHGVRLVSFRFDDRQRQDQALHQVIKLHRAVGKAILLHEYGSGRRLPSKKGSLRWTLGEGVRVLRALGRADFALFVYLRDSFSGDGERYSKVASAKPGPRQSDRAGFASLVDLRNGDIVWFNRLHGEIGDLRNPSTAQGASRILLARLPL